MKNLKQLETELAVCEQLPTTEQYQVTGGKSTAQSDDKRRERPGSNIGNRANGGSRRQYACVAEVKS